MPHLELILKARGISIMRFCKEIGINYYSGYRVITGDTGSIPIRYIVKFCQHLNLTPDALLGYSDLAVKEYLAAFGKNPHKVLTHDQLLGQEEEKV